MIFQDDTGKAFHHGRDIRQDFIDRDGYPVLTTDGRLRMVDAGWWRKDFGLAAIPIQGWPLRPWDHRLLKGEGGSIDRVAITQSGDVIVDLDGDLVQTGPGFDYEAVKVVHCRPSPEPARVPVPVDRFEPEMEAILAGARRTAELFGHTWVGTEDGRLPVRTVDVAAALPQPLAR